MKWMKRQTSQCDISYPQGIFFDFLENPTPESHRSSRGGLRPGTPAWSGSTRLLVVAVCACALHAQLQTANVEVNVYFPGGFLRSDSRVFLSSENNNEVTVISNDTQLKINVFGKYMSVIWRPKKYSKGTKLALDILRKLLTFTFQTYSLFSLMSNFLIYLQTRLVPQEDQRPL